MWCHHAPVQRFTSPRLNERTAACAAKRTGLFATMVTYVFDKTLNYYSSTKYNKINTVLSTYSSCICDLDRENHHFSGCPDSHVISRERAPEMEYKFTAAGICPGVSHLSFWSEWGGGRRYLIFYTLKQSAVRTPKQPISPCGSSTCVERGGKLEFFKDRGMWNGVFEYALSNGRNAGTPK